MKNPFNKALILVLLAASLPLAAAVDVREFSSQEMRERYQHLVEELRCPKCQNQNLAGSDSPIATDLRRELYRQLEEGKTNTEIKAFMVSRYGDYVLYRPPVQSNTLLLWWGPPAIFTVAVLIVLFLVWRRRSLLKQHSNDATYLTDEDQARLDKLLAQSQGLPVEESGNSTNQLNNGR